MVTKHLLRYLSHHRLGYPTGKYKTRFDLLLVKGDKSNPKTLYSRHHESSAADLAVVIQEKKSRH